MGNMCCRRVVYSPNGVEAEQQSRCLSQPPQQEPPQPQKSMSAAFHPAGDDCAINELLEGRMDLDVILPDGRQVRLTVERRTPMMDLLVQAASATKISPAGHTIHVFRGDDTEGTATLHYKPSTPIGSLDANVICIVPKKDSDSNGRKNKPANRPFEPTFRVQVHLPRNQLTVLRVSPRVRIEELREMVCCEKGMDSSRYQLVRPADPSRPLDGDTTLAEYGSTEITLLSNSSIESHLCSSTSHIMPYPKRAEELKRKTGILRLLTEDTNHKLRPKPPTLSCTIHAPSRSAPNIRVTSTDAPQPHKYKQKKRRPAPPPPPPVLPEPPFHSRQSSSDSSGYHEATSSYLHEEHEEKTHVPDEKASSDSSGVSSLDAKDANAGEAATSVQVSGGGGGRKRKAPPPPSSSAMKQNDGSLTSYAQSDTEQQVLVSETHLVHEDDKTALDVAMPACPTVEITPSSRGGADCSLPETHRKCNQDEKVEPESAQNVAETACPAVDSANPKNADLALRESHRSSIQEKKEEEPAESEVVTKAALVTLTARIEQDVTQQEIASSIQAAFQSLDSGARKITPSLLSIRPRNGMAPVKSLVDDSEDGGDGFGNPHPDDAKVPGSYPLQKSPAVLTLNLDAAVEEEYSELESFPPPPLEFVDKEEEEPFERKSASAGQRTLRRSSSLLSLADSRVTVKSQARSRNLQRSLSDLRPDDKAEFSEEQQRLQQEYIKLQRQFLLWQQQLLENHAMLSEECIVPSYARTLRQSHSLPEGEEYIVPSCPLVSRSFSYEPTKDRFSTLPRSAINIPPLEFGSVITNGSSTLRSSKAKSHFKPPQVRVSTKNRQRLPPEIRKDGDLDLYDDSRILSAVLPSFENLDEVYAKNVKNVRNGDVIAPEPDVPLNNGVNKRPQDGGKKVPPPVPSKTNCHSRSNGTTTTNGFTNGYHSHLSPANGDAVTSNGERQSVPPALTLHVELNGKTWNNSNTSSTSGCKLDAKKGSRVAPREELMQEIRRCGGRTALRKISLDMPS